MNLPNKITITRILLSFIMIIILLLPDGALGIKWPTYLINNEPLSLQYIIAGLLFAISSLTDFLDGYLARKYDLVTDFGKVSDAIADKVLVNGLLVVLAANSVIEPFVAVIIIIRDIIVDSLKMVSGNNGKVVAASFAGKAKTMCMMIGLTLVMFNNLPFSFINFRLGDLLIYVATILSVVSAIQYYCNTKEFLFPKKKN